jgi:DNA polymerase III epsilon subunit-like protein
MSPAPVIVAPPQPPKEDEMAPPDDEILKDTTTSATATATAAAAATATTTPSSMDKEARKRLKKLRKRATNAISDGERSGFLTRLEWLEFQKLTADDETSGVILRPNSSDFVGPAIARRTRKETKKVEGSHHRDIIAWLMDRVRHPNGDPQQLTKKKKRARNTNTDGEDDDQLQNPTIPSWASIHNAPTIDNLVVLEVQVSSSTKIESSSSAQLDKLQSIVDAAVAQSKGRRSPLHLPTKWFQGHVPKAMSDSLFYFMAKSTIANKRSRMQQEDVSPSKDQLMKDLEEMILPLDDWSAEGYPIAVKTGNEADQKQQPPQVPTMAPSSLQEYDSISKNEAKEFVAKCGFRIEHQKEDDVQLFIRTRAATSDVEDQLPSEVRVFGMDCEMVLTSLGSELARITLVEFKSFENNQLETTTVLDALVKPENPVKDYLTRHSGITAKLLGPVSTRLVQIQVALQQFLRPTDILVGHSLENDLMAAHFCHPRVVDTSLIFRHRNKRTKFSLRHMSAYLLKKSIQDGSHCSEEDAEATLELAIRRAWLGDCFGVPNNDDRRSVLEKWNGDKEMKMVCIGPPAWLQTHVTNQANGAHALGYESIPECKKAISAWTKDGPRKAHLTWCNLNICDDATAANNDFEAFQQMLVRTCTVLADERMHRVSYPPGVVDHSLTSFFVYYYYTLQIDLLQSTLPTATILVTFQQGLDNSREAFAKRRASQDPRSSLGWGAEKEAAWQSVLESSRQGLASWIGATNSSLVD